MNQVNEDFLPFLVLVLGDVTYFCIVKNLFQLLIRFEASENLQIQEIASFLLFVLAYKIFSPISNF